jgi:hypothetical protein
MVGIEEMLAAMTNYCLSQLLVPVEVDAQRSVF